jgi:hypothetical protein
LPSMLMTSSIFWQIHLWIKSFKKNLHLESRLISWERRITSISGPSTLQTQWEHHMPPVTRRLRQYVCQHNGFIGCRAVISKNDTLPLRSCHWHRVAAQHSI